MKRYKDVTKCKTRTVFMEDPEGEWCVFLEAGLKIQSEQAKNNVYRQEIKKLKEDNDNYRKRFMEQFDKAVKLRSIVEELRLKEKSDV